MEFLETPKQVFIFCFVGLFGGALVILNILFLLIEGELMGIGCTTGIALLGLVYASGMAIVTQYNIDRKEEEKKDEYFDENINETIYVYCINKNVYYNITNHDLNSDIVLYFNLTGKSDFCNNYIRGVAFRCVRENLTEEEKNVV